MAGAALGAAAANATEPTSNNAPAKAIRLIVTASSNILAERIAASYSLFIK
jgi:hypothetical protein